MPYRVDLSTMSHHTFREVWVLSPVIQTDGLPSFRRAANDRRLRHLTFERDLAGRLGPEKTEAEAVRQSATIRRSNKKVSSRPPPADIEIRYTSEERVSALHFKTQDPLT